jgi:tryptophanase
MRAPRERFRIKMIERVRATTRAERDRALAAARLNLFLLSADDVELDLLTFTTRFERTRAPKHSRHDPARHACAIGR